MEPTNHDVTGGRKLTPMLRQYVDAKAEAPDAILLFRMGDFYELFFEDAKVAARELDLTLTTRDKGPDAIPMAGVPHHAVSGYIAKLIERGYAVAVCDQVEDPRQAKGLVRREITRLITPGTVADPNVLEPGAASYLAFVADRGDGSGHAIIALLDLLAGEILCTHREMAGVGDELRRMGAREVLTESDQRDLIGGIVGRSIPVRAVSDPQPEEKTVRDTLTDRFGCDYIDGMQGGGTTAERRAVYRLVLFAERTQRRQLRHLVPPRAYAVSDYLMLDEATRRNLELLTTQVDARKQGSVRWHLDRCRTAMGSRMLSHWLLFPLRQKAAIEARQAAVGTLVGDRGLRGSLQEALDGVRDIERLVGRVTVGRATPRDLGALRASLAGVAATQSLLKQHDEALGTRWAQLDAANDVLALLERALVAEPPTAINEGGIFAQGFRQDLDELITLSTEGHGFLSALESRERERTGIASLKVRYNKVFGYYIEITRANLDQVPADYVRKQTLVNAERFITEELKSFEDKVLTADERRKGREAELFDDLVTEVGQQVARLRAVARLIAETDALASLAQVADEGRYVRPTLTEAQVLVLEQSRHPVLERLMPGGERFVPNDLRLNTEERQLMIVTGPNMAGKSTVMRQAALCTILAHMGAYVPADNALVGLCDRLFTRVGAADNLSRGQSTFMVEMTETASILRDATDRSLVLLDEIGRGTSTFDGVSIAWAVAEHLHDQIGCRAMFATHYHELTDLARERPRILNASVAVKEHGGSVVFLRQLVDTPANRSYGIQVARLAGLPDSLLERAREILANLEQGELDESGMPVLAHSRRPGRNKARSSQLQLFSAPQREPSPVEKAVAALDVLNTSPMRALEVLQELQTLLEKQPGNKHTSGTKSASKSASGPKIQRQAC